MIIFYSTMAFLIVVTALLDYFAIRNYTKEYPYPKGIYVLNFCLLIISFILLIIAIIQY